MAGLPVDRAGAAGAAGGRGHGPVAGAAPLRPAGLRLVRPDAGLRAAALGAGADPQLPLVRAGLHGRRAGSRAGPQQPRAAHDGGRRPAGGTRRRGRRSRRHRHPRGAAPLQDLRVGLADRHPPAADGAGLEVRGRRGPAGGCVGVGPRSVRGAAAERGWPSARRHRHGGGAGRRPLAEGGRAGGAAGWFEVGRCPLAEARWMGVAASAWSEVNVDGWQRVVRGGCNGGQCHLVVGGGSPFPG